MAPWPPGSSFRQLMGAPSPLPSSRHRCGPSGVPSARRSPGMGTPATASCCLPAGDVGAGVRGRPAAQRRLRCPSPGRPPRPPSPPSARNPGDECGCRQQGRARRTCANYHEARSAKVTRARSLRTRCTCPNSLGREDGSEGPGPLIPPASKSRSFRSPRAGLGPRRTGKLGPESRARDPQGSSTGAPPSQGCCRP